MKMTNLSIMTRDSLETEDGVLVSFINAPVTSGKLSHVFQAVFIVCPAMKDVVSHPVKAWTAGRHLDLDGRRVNSNRCAVRTILWFFPAPEDSQSSFKSRDTTAATASTITTVSVVQIMTDL